MTEAPFVTGAGIRVTIEIEGRTYTVRPLTFGEASQLAALELAAPPPGAAIITEAVRQALERKLADEPARLQQLLADIEAHEAADDESTAIVLSRPGSAEPEAAQADWRRSWREAQQRLLAASRKRERAEHLVADDAELLRLRALAMKSSHGRMVEMVRLALVRWEGEGLEPWAPGEDGRATTEQITGLPAGDFQRVQRVADQMLRPSRDQEKN